MTVTKELLGRLEEEPIKTVKFSRGWIFVEYDGEKIVDHIIIEKHQEYVGRWDIDLNVVYVDDDLEGLDMEAVVVHEVIEKYVSQKYDLDPYKEAHDIATIKEREFLEKKRGNWQSHQLKVAHIWKMESKRSH